MLRVSRNWCGGTRRVLSPLRPFTPSPTRPFTPLASEPFHPFRLSPLLIPLALLLFATSARAQGTKADYERAAGLWNTFSPLLADTADPPEWIDGGPRFCYLARRADVWQFMVVDPVKATKAPAFDQEKLGTALAAATKQEVNPKFLPFDRVRLDGGKVRFRAFKKPWAFDPVANTVTPDANPDGDKPKLPRPHPDSRATQFDSQAVSPDGKWEASIDTGFNVTVRNRDTDSSASLTSDGTDRDPYLAEFYWSPDSSRLVVMRETAVEKNKVTLVESAPTGGGRPRTVTYEQPQPGDKLSRSSTCGRTRPSNSSRTSSPTPTNSNPCGGTATRGTSPSCTTPGGTSSCASSR
jgi:dipeptidyl-peptidase 4